MSGRFKFPHAYDPQMHQNDLTTLSRTASHHAPPAANRPNGPSHTPSVMSAAKPPTKSDRNHARKHYVFTDPVAFRYLEEDASTVVIERRGKLEGYESYLVEQWACSRVHPTFVITTYTGDKNHSVVIAVLGVPVDEGLWSPRLQVYFRAISQYHARPTETPLGTLMVTSLSSFPSNLTVIPVPGGDIRKHREDFIVNEDLKRLGCAGRSGISLAPPAGATHAKFQQLFRTSDRIPLYGAVIELVKLCQVALMIFGKLEQEYADGCLCDVTERAILAWWTEIGSEHYNTEPADGVLGPTTVAGMLGLLMGARNRLNYLNCPVAKDAFDVYSLKRGIAHFQKAQKLERTRRLDRHTLDRLHKVTARAAAGEGWGVPKAVKSTVAELSGKGGEMVMGLVGRDKDGMGDIETLDIDHFVSLVHGERAKWLWYGKPRRSAVVEEFGRSKGSENLSFTKNDQGGYIWSHNRSDSMPPDDEADMNPKEKDSPSAVYSDRSPASTTGIPESPSDRDTQLRKMVLKSVTGKMENAKSGFGRIKDAVGLRGHISRHSRDEGAYTDLSGPNSAPLPPFGPLSSEPTLVSKAFTWKDTPMQYQNGISKAPKEPVSRPTSTGRILEPDSFETDVHKNIPIISVIEEPPQDMETERRWLEQVKDIRRDLVANDPSIAGSYDEGDLEGPLLGAERDPNSFQALLHRRSSVAGDASTILRRRNEAWWPRQMSFNDASEAVLSWEPIFTHSYDEIETDTGAAMQAQRYKTDNLKHLYAKISELQDDISPWVEDKLHDVDKLDEQYAQDQENFRTLRYQFVEQYEDMKQNSQDLLGTERLNMNEAVKEIDILGAKLEYEIESLLSKVRDVEDGVDQFERQVDELESKANELETQLRTESWIHWAVRSLTGIGTGPPP